MLFKFAKIIIDASEDEKTGLPTIDGKDILIAILALLFGAFQMANAQSYGADVGKA